MARPLGGAQMADHYAVVARVTGRNVVQEPKLPMALRYLWNHFATLHAARTGNGFGANPIGWGELKAYCELTCTRLDPWEVHAIRAVDDEYLQSTVN